MSGLDLVALIKSAGYIGIFLCLLLENGVFIFFFMPGDSLLLTAGFLAGQGVLDVKIVVIGSFITAILGYMTGYFIGKKLGLKFFHKYEGRFVEKTHLDKTREFYRKYGNLALVLARFLPFRSFICFLAGVVEMPYGAFMFYNVLGAFAWAVVLPLIGYYLGTIIPLDHLELLLLVPVGAALGTIVIFQVVLFFRRRKLLGIKNQNQK